MFRTLKSVFAKKYCCIEERPYFDYKLKDIENLYLRYLSLGDKGAVETIAYELSFRTTSSSKELFNKVQESKRLLSSSIDIDSPDKNLELTSASQIEMKPVDEDTNQVNKISNINHFISFYMLVKKIMKSDKPEVLIDSNIWKMLCKSLKNDDKQHTILLDFARKTELIWPYSKSKEEISDYLYIDFDELKTRYGWDQKKVIICAVAMTSYAKVKSWRLLNERYGTKAKEGDSLSNGTPEHTKNITTNKKSEAISFGRIAILKASQKAVVKKIEKEEESVPGDEPVKIKNNIDDIFSDFGL